MNKCHDCTNLVEDINPNTNTYYFRCRKCRTTNNTRGKKYYREISGRPKVAENKHSEREKHPLEDAIRKSLSRYATMPDWEDAIQEALIQTWRDEGKYDEQHTKARAVIRGKNILLHQTGLQGGSTMFGHVGRKSTEGVVRPQGEATRAKIQQFINEYQELHGKTPTNVEISKAVGINKGTIGVYMTKAKNQGVSVPLLEVRVHSLFTYEAEDEEAFSEAITRSAVVWEDSTVDTLAVNSMLKLLNNNQKQAVYYTHWMQYSTRQAAKAMGVTPTTVQRYLKTAYKILRENYEAE